MRQARPQETPASYPGHTTRLIVYGRCDTVVYMNIPRLIALRQAHDELEALRAERDALLAQLNLHGDQDALLTEREALLAQLKRDGRQHRVDFTIPAQRRLQQYLQVQRWRLRQTHKPQSAPAEMYAS